VPVDVCIHLLDGGLPDDVVVFPLVFWKFIWLLGAIDEGLIFVNKFMVNTIVEVQIVRLFVVSVCGARFRRKFKRVPMFKQLLKVPRQHVIDVLLIVVRIEWAKNIRLFW